MSKQRASVLATAAVTALFAVVSTAYAQTDPDTGTVSPSAQQMSFNEALSKVRGENETIRAAGVAVQRARAERGIAIARFVPEITLNARVTRLDSPIDLNLDPVRQWIGDHTQIPAAALPDFRYVIQNEGFANVTLKGTMPLFTGGRLLAGIRAADLAVTGVEAEERQALAVATTELVKRYFGSRMAAEALNVRRATAESLRTHAYNAKRLEESGQISRAELLRAEVALAEAEMELASAERQAKLTSQALATMLSQTGTIQPTSSFFRVEQLPDLDELKRQALRTSPLLDQVSSGRARAREGVRVARGEFAPTIGAFGLVELYRGDLTILDPAWAFGLNLEWHLLQGGQRFHKLAAARALEQEVVLKQSRAEQDIQLLVEQRYQNYEDAAARLQQFELTRELAEESLRSQQRAFQAGLSTSLDVVDAEITLSRVNLGILKSLFDADVAFAELMEAVGQSEILLDFIEMTEAPVSQESRP